MASRGRAKARRRLLPGAVESGLRRLLFGGCGIVFVPVPCGVGGSLAPGSVHDPSLNNATRALPSNWLGSWGAVLADITIQMLGLAAIILFLPLAAWGWHLGFHSTPDRRKMRLLAWPVSVIMLAAAFAALPQPKSWPLPNGLGGILGDFLMAGAHVIGPFLPEAAGSFVPSTSRLIALGAPRSGAAGEWANASLGAAMHVAMHTGAKLRHTFRRRDSEEEPDEVEEADDGEDANGERPGRAVYADGRIEPSFGPAPIGEEFDEEEEDDEVDDITSPNFRITRLDAAKKKKH